MAGDEARVLAAVEARRAELIEFVGRLVATPSVNPPGDERGVVALLQAESDRLGLGRGTVHAAEPHRPNLFIHLPGRGGGRHLILNGHTDTKPVGEAAAQWRSDPFTPTVRDGYLHGLGSADMKGAVGAMLFAAAALRDLPTPPSGDLTLVFSADEENGSRLGAAWLAGQGLLAADAAVIGEPCGVEEDWETLCLLSRGVCCFVLRFHGTQGHSSLSDRLGMVNASEQMGRALGRLRRELRLSYPPHPLVPGGPTINPGVRVQGGVFYGVNPGQAEFATDIRTLPGMRRDEVEASVRAFLARLREEDPRLHVELEWRPSPGDWKPAAEIAPDQPVVAALEDAAARVLGRRPPRGAFAGGTDAPHFALEAGIPTVPAFGPGLLTVAHGPNERVRLESIVQAAKIYALAALRYVGGS